MHKLVDSPNNRVILIKINWLTAIRSSCTKKGGMGKRKEGDERNPKINVIIIRLEDMDDIYYNY